MKVFYLVFHDESETPRFVRVSESETPSALLRGLQTCPAGHSSVFEGIAYSPDVEGLVSTSFLVQPSNYSMIDALESSEEVALNQLRAEYEDSLDGD